MSLVLKSNKKKSIILWETKNILNKLGGGEICKYDLSVFDGLNVDISGAFVWDEHIDTNCNPNITGEFVDNSKKNLSKNVQCTENFYKMIHWVEQNKIPTRIAINVVKSIDEAKKDMEKVKKLMKKLDASYAFISDFNFKLDRKNLHCYMHMVKPFIFTDGNVYVCPSSELAVENQHNMNDEFLLCSIDGIEKFYQKGVKMRNHSCSYCKYAMQNELIDELLMEVDHEEFA